MVEIKNISGESYLHVRSKLPSQNLSGVIFEIEQKNIELKKIYETLQFKLKFKCSLEDDERIPACIKIEEHDSSIFVEHNFTGLQPGNMYQVTLYSFIKDVDVSQDLFSGEVTKNFTTGSY
jgi:hypothetical protein